MPVNPTPSSDKRIEENNTELLREYSRRLSIGTPQEFHRAVEPMTKWLSDRRAYYPLARRQLITFLRQAENTLSKILSAKSRQQDASLIDLIRVAHGGLHPTIDEYLKLLRVVMRFIEYFVEPDQRAQLEEIFVRAGLMTLQQRIPPPRVTGVAIPNPLPSYAVPQAVPPQAVAPLPAAAMIAPAFNPQAGPSKAISHVPTAPQAYISPTGPYPMMPVSSPSPVPHVSPGASVPQLSTRPHVSISPTTIVGTPQDETVFPAASASSPNPLFHPVRISPVAMPYPSIQAANTIIPSPKTPSTPVLSQSPPNIPLAMQMQIMPSAISAAAPSPSSSNPTPTAAASPLPPPPVASPSSHAPQMAPRTNLPAPPILKGKKKRKKSSFVLSADVIDADDDWITRQKKSKSTVIGAGDSKEDVVEKENIQTTLPVPDSAEFVENERVLSDVTEEIVRGGTAERKASGTPGLPGLPQGNITSEIIRIGADIKMAVEEDAQRANGAIESTDMNEIRTIAPVNQDEAAPVAKNNATQNDDRVPNSQYIPVDTTEGRQDGRTTRSATPHVFEWHASTLDIDNDAEKQEGMNVNRVIEEDGMDVDELPNADIQAPRSSSVNLLPSPSPDLSNNDASKSTSSPQISAKAIHNVGAALKSVASVSPELSTVKLSPHASATPPISRAPPVCPSLEPIVATASGPATSTSEQAIASPSRFASPHASSTTSPALSVGTSEHTSHTTRLSTPSYSSSDIIFVKQQHRVKSESIEHDSTSLLAPTATTATTATAIATSPAPTSPAPAPALPSSASQPIKSYRSIARNILCQSTGPPDPIPDQRRQVSMPIKLISSRNKLISALSIRNLAGEGSSIADRLVGPSNDEGQRQEEAKLEAVVEKSAVGVNKTPEVSADKQNGADINGQDESMNLDSDSEDVEHSQLDVASGPPPEYGSDESVWSTKRGASGSPGTTILFVKLQMEQVRALRAWRKRRSNPMLAKTDTCEMALSLACYSSSAVFERVKARKGKAAATGEPHDKHLFHNLPCVWPQGGQISLTALWYNQQNGKSTKVKIPLPPPLVTPEKCIDITPFALSCPTDRNDPNRQDFSVSLTLTFTHADVSLRDHTFVVYAHAPTQAQLDELTNQAKDIQRSKESLAAAIRRNPMPGSSSVVRWSAIEVRMREKEVSAAH